jgi:hypothetical protein
MSATEVNSQVTIEVVGLSNIPNHRNVPTKIPLTPKKKDTPPGTNVSTIISTIPPIKKMVVNISASISIILP